jgi:hypothetical protein
MAKKGLDEDRLKFFKGMGGHETTESDKTGSDVIKSEMSESDETKSELSMQDKIESAKSEYDISDSDKTKSVISESDKIVSVLSESDNQKSIAKRRRTASKITLPRSRAPSAIPSTRAKKVDDTVLEQAISAASKSPKVSIYSPFVAAVMKCNELTTIGYKSSADSRELLEKALEQAYPDVCEKVRRYMETN